MVIHTQTTFLSPIVHAFSLTFFPLHVYELIYLYTYLLILYHKIQRIYTLATQRMMDGQRDQEPIKYLMAVFNWKGESGLYKIALSPSIHWATIKVIREMESFSEAYGRVCKEKSLGGKGKHSSSRKVGVLE